MSDVVHNSEKNRFELTRDGQVAVADYRLDGAKMIIAHVGVPPVLEGKGIGGMLVKAALEHARVAELKVVPVCPFAAAWLKRHPEYQDLTE